MLLPLLLVCGCASQDEPSDQGRMDYLRCYDSCDKAFPLEGMGRDGCMDSCRLDYAQASDDTGQCDKTVMRHSRAACYGNLAKIRADAGLCDQLEDPGDRDLCHLASGFGG